MSELLSPGLAYGCFELLDLLHRSSMQLEDARALGKLGVVSAERAVKLSIELGWVEVGSHGRIHPTERGRSVCSGSEVECRLRLALLDIVEFTNPPWAQNARFGRRRFLRFAPSEIAQLCAEAGVANGVDDDTVGFWDALAARARGIRDSQLNEIGRIGEKLTLRYEALRTGREPVWVALDSSEDGYDVLSQVGRDDARRLCIEVKASTKGTSGSVFVTRNEWETAVSLPNYRVYLWDISSSPMLAILNLADMESNMPSNRGLGRWESASVSFSAFKSLFYSVDIRVD